MPAQTTATTNEGNNIWIPNDTMNPENVENNLTEMQERYDAIDKQNDERIIEILGMGLLDRQELREVLDEYLDDCSDNDSSYANDSLVIARRVRKSNDLSNNNTSFGADSLEGAEGNSKPPVVKDRLEIEFSSAVFKVGDTSMEVKDLSSKTHIATGGISKLKPLKFSNTAA